MKQGVNLEVSINVSTSDILMDDFIDLLKKCFAEYPLVPPSNLQLEILESSTLSNMEAIQKVLHRCQTELGISIALDDFGTGYSSLSHLSMIPADTIKIDRSFINDLLHDHHAYMIVDAVINLGHTFKRTVIAEGVETTEQGALLIQLGCTHAQGYGIAKPMCSEDFLLWRKHYAPNPSWLKPNLVEVHRQHHKNVGISNN